MRNGKIISNNLIRPKKMLKLRADFKSAFITGGIGDVIAVDGILNPEERRSFKHIFYATCKYKYLKELLSKVPPYDSMTYESVWDDFSKFWAFNYKSDYLRLSKNTNAEVVNATDLSISVMFDKIRNGSAKYHTSSFLSHTLSDIKKFSLPERYVILAPYSTDKRIQTRDFSFSDWSESLKILEKTNTYGVVLNNGNDIPVFNDRVINLCNKTTIFESIEILKAAKGYLGIDTWLSVLAPKIFDADDMQIKVQYHARENSMCYFAPHTTFPFLVDSIQCS